MGKHKSGDLDLTRMFIADAKSPTIVRIAEASQVVSRLTVGGIDVKPQGDVTVVAPAAVAGPVAVNIDVPSAASVTGNVELFTVEILTGTRSYREVLPLLDRAQKLRFSLVYGEPEPDFIDCPRHGLVRPKNGACPLAAPHT
jgi:hypothetical protein